MRDNNLCTFFSLLLMCSLELLLLLASSFSNTLAVSSKNEPPLVWFACPACWDGRRSWLCCDAAVDNVSFADGRFDSVSRRCARSCCFSCIRIILNALLIASGFLSRLSAKSTLFWGHWNKKRSKSICACRCFILFSLSSFVFDEYWCYNYHRKRMGAHVVTFFVPPKR